MTTKQQRLRKQMLRELERDLGDYGIAAVRIENFDQITRIDPFDLFVQGDLTDETDHPTQPND